MRKARTWALISLPVVLLHLSGCGGAVAINSNGTSNSTSTYRVDLTWDAPVNSPDPVAGYLVYRAPVNTFNVQQVNSSVISQTSYVDNAVQRGQTYDYYVVSVDAVGNTSDLSDKATAAIP